jgi:arylsulfatase A-like enzyme
MYDDSDGAEQVTSAYDNVSHWPPGLLKRTRANYSGLVTMCDRWFGHLYETMRVLGLLDNALLIVTSDHGHSLGDEGYLGKRGYPSEPAVFDVPFLIRHPDGTRAGETSDALVQQTDISATILDFAGVKPSQVLDGHSLLETTPGECRQTRDHVTVGWGSTVTAIDNRWWLNIKIDGTDPLLY